MEELVPQQDGCYALCFRNFKNITTEEVQKKFSKFGHVYSIRTSNEPTPWVFIRYKIKEEAQNAMSSLQDCKDIDIRVAKSYAKKPQEQEGEHSGRSDFYASDNTRENRTMKDNRKRNNNFTGKFAKEDTDQRNVDDVESTTHTFQKAEVLSLKSPNANDRKHSEGREDAEDSHRKNDSPSPRLVNKSPGQHANGAIPRQSRQPDDNGPPKLVKASEYYALDSQEKSSSVLASKAAYQEVWSNHPLHSEMQLWEMVLTNFMRPPSKKEIYELCEGINLLHVSVGKTYDREYSYCRVLVATEDDANSLYALDGAVFNGSEVVVTCLEDLLETLLD